MQEARREAQPPVAAAPAPASRDLLRVLALAWLLVIARSVVYITDEEAFFNSDQAITGLMAKHLLEGRAFPLFYYGQGYLLGVQAWVAVPFFLVAGPTVAALITSVLASNLATVTLLIVGFARGLGLSPWVALVPSLFYAVPPAASTFWLLEAGGANGMPFFYIALLWFLRDRPLWFGGTAALAFLNREFSAYALPQLALIEVFTGRLRARRRWTHWVLAAVAALAVAATVQALKPYADYFGPGTRGQLLRGFDESQAGNLQQRATFSLTDMPQRAAAMAVDHAPRLLGAGAFDDGIGQRGYPALRWLLIAGLTALSLRVGALWSRRTAPWFGLYLAGAGAVSAVVYVLTRPATNPVDRYFVLVLLVPIGLTAMHLALESRRGLRLATIGVTLIWSVLMAVDHGRLALDIGRQGPSHALRDVIDALRARDVAVAETGYWRAYKLTFLSRERPIVAATDFARIDDYQHRASQAGAALVSIREAPCAGGQPVGEYYLCAAGAP